MIILATGMGKRPKELTKDNIKHIIRVCNQTLIERMLKQLEALSLKCIIIVIGYKGEKIRELIGGKVNNTPVFYVENDVYDKTNSIYSLYLAKDYLMEDEAILPESDLVFENSVLSKSINYPYSNLAVVTKYQSRMDGTVVQLDEDNNMLNFISKKAFQFCQKEFYHKTVNIYKFSKEFSTNKHIPLLEAYYKALGNNEYYEQVLKVISLLDRPDLKASTITTEKWYETDDQQDLNNVEVLLSEGK